MALHSSLWLAWQAFCSLTVAMVSAGAALQCSLAPSVLGVSWVEKCCDSTHFLTGGWNPSCCHSSVFALAYINTIPDSSSDTQLDSKQDCCLGLDKLHQFEGKIMLGKLNRFACLLPKDPGAVFRHWEWGKTNKYSRAILSPETERSLISTK